MGSFKKPGEANWFDIAVVCVTAMVGIAALAGAMRNWMSRKTTLIERRLPIAAGLALVYPRRCSITSA